MKLYKNAAVADPLANYTLRDYGFELIDSYKHVKWFEPFFLYVVLELRYLALQLNYAVWFWN